MKRSRTDLVSLEATPCYYCVCCCVRRAFQCGEVEHPGQNFDHRKAWVQDRHVHPDIYEAVDITACAVMGRSCSRKTDIGYISVSRRKIQESNSAGRGRGTGLHGLRGSQSYPRQNGGNPGRKGGSVNMKQGCFYKHPCFIVA